MTLRYKKPEQKNDEDETMGSFYMGRMRPPPEPQRVLPKGLLAGVTFVAFAIILWYAYPRGVEQQNMADVPLIAADKAPYKFKPENPGGMEVRHQDSTVFNPLVKKEVAEVERLAPQPEEPMDKEEALKGAEPAKEEPTLEQTTDMKLDLQVDADEPTAEKVVPLMPPQPDAPKVEEKAAEVKPAEEKLVEEKAAETKPEPKPETVAKKEEVATPTPAAAAGYYMQLGSFKDAAVAKSEWSKLQKKYPQSLSALGSRVERTDLGFKGIWHRLYAGPQSKDKATETCKKLIAAGAGGCLVRKL